VRSFSSSAQFVVLSSAALADIEHRLASIEVDVDLSALAGGHAEVVGITNVDSYALGWMNVLTHSVLLSGYTYIISTRKG
jgi:hypothetical protein